MIIKTRLGIKEFVDLVKKNVVLSTNIESMSYIERNSTSYDYYGEVSNAGFVLSRLSKGTRGIQHSFMYGGFELENENLIIRIKPVPSISEIVSFVLSASIMVFAMFNNSIIGVLPPIIICILSSLSFIHECLLFKTFILTLLEKTQIAENNYQ